MNAVGLQTNASSLWLMGGRGRGGGMWELGVHDLFLYRR